MSLQRIQDLAWELTEPAASQALMAMLCSPGRPRHRLIPFVPAMNQLARSAYGVELSSLSLRRALRELYKRQDHKKQYCTNMRCTHHAHCLFSSAHGFWSLLSAIGEYSNDETVNSIHSNYESEIEETRTARHHFEHLSERIYEGRPGHRSGVRPAMDESTVWRGVAVFRADVIVFGDEEFSYTNARAAVLSAMEQFVPYACNTIKLSVNVGVT